MASSIWCGTAPRLKYPPRQIPFGIWISLFRHNWPLWLNQRPCNENSDSLCPGVACLGAHAEGPWSASFCCVWKGPGAVGLLFSKQPPYWISGSIWRHWGRTEMELGRLCVMLGTLTNLIPELYLLFSSPSTPSSFPSQPLFPSIPRSLKSLYHKEKREAAGDDLWNIEFPLFLTFITAGFPWWRPLVWLCNLWVLGVELEAGAQLDSHTPITAICPAKIAFYSALASLHSIGHHA